jgi:hypothetical protein
MPREAVILGGRVETFWFALLLRIARQTGCDPLMGFWN